MEGSSHSDWPLTRPVVSTLRQTRGAEMTTDKPKRGVGRPKGRRYTEEVRARLTPGIRALVDESIRQRGCAESEWWRRAALHYVAEGAPCRYRLGGVLPSIGHQLPMTDHIDRKEWEASQRDAFIRLRSENAEIAERNVNEYERLEAESKALKTRLAQMDADFIKQQVRLKILAEQWAHGKAVKLLMAHEWVLDGRECLNYCLHCQRLIHEGHSDDCEAFGPRGVIPPDVRAAMESE